MDPVDANVNSKRRVYRGNIVVALRRVVRKVYPVFSEAPMSLEGIMTEFNGDEGIMTEFNGDKL